MLAERVVGWGSGVCGVSGVGIQINGGFMLVDGQSRSRVVAELDRYPHGLAFGPLMEAVGHVDKAAFERLLTNLRARKVIKLVAGRWKLVQVQRPPDDDDKKPIPQATSARKVIEKKTRLEQPPPVPEISEQEVIDSMAYLQLLAGYFDEAGNDLRQVYATLEALAKREGIL